MSRSSITYYCLSALLAVNYLAFRTEIFDEEFVQNHPVSPTSVAFNYLSINWETFDKENAPKAFVFDARIDFRVIDLFRQQLQNLAPLISPFHVVRDKSPPRSAQLV